MDASKIYANGISSHTDGDITFTANFMLPNGKETSFDF